MMHGCLVWLLLLISGVLGYYDDDSVLKEYELLNKKSLNWGPYRSNLYLGVRPRIPESLITGLLWFSPESFRKAQLSKHTCDQNHNLETFGWTKYDPRFGGIETIFDNDLGLKLDASFVKTDDGMNWALRIKGSSSNPDAVNSLIFYTGLEAEGQLELGSKFVDGTNNIIDGDIILNGNSAVLGGDFTIKFVDNVQNRTPNVHTIDFDDTFDPSLSHHVSITAPGNEMWQGNEIFWALVKMNVEELKEKEISTKKLSAVELFQLRNSNDFKGNLHYVQKTFVGDFEFDIIYNTGESLEKIEDYSISERITETLEKVYSKFTKKFQLQAPFNTVEHIQFAQEILSQLLGGIIYSHGDQQVDRNAIVDDVEFSHARLKGTSEGPHELFTCVPSRPFFPRGFYWDEGFHLLPLLEYDTDLTLEIVKSWFSLIDENGWIAREQILGAEARSKVPAEFTVQNPNIANPPTLMLIFSELLDSAKQLHLQQAEDSLYEDGSELKFQNMKDLLGDLHMDKPELMIQYAQEIYSKLQLHYEWFRRTQKGNTVDFDRSYPSNAEIYCWKGRTKDHCLPSGIDDYPRCEADIGELNVDLISWMGVMTRSMYKIAQLLEKFDDAKLYKDRLDNIIENIDKVHWSEAEKLYCDVTVDDDDEDIFECHEGYVTLMPFIHRLIPVKETEKLKHVLQGITDPERLWTPYGLRSLSKKDSKFHSGEDYWRGHIWININYLTLESLQYYGNDPDLDESLKSLINETYVALRENVINNIYSNYKSTGYAWEQYNEETGSGQRTRHFLGWTSLVILMMKMPAEL